MWFKKKNLILYTSVCSQIKHYRMQWDHIRLAQILKGRGDEVSNTFISLAWFELVKLVVFPDFLSYLHLDMTYRSVLIVILNYQLASSPWSAVPPCVWLHRPLCLGDSASSSSTTLCPADSPHWNLSQMTYLKG